MKLAESIYNGLTNLGNGIDHAIEKQITWNRENRETGWLPDEEKLRFLKYDLYRNARTGKDTSELRKAINTLSKEIERETAFNNSLTAQLNTFTNTVLVVGVSAIVGSFLVTGLGCRNQSKFCTDTANISNSIIKYFTGE
ncbi:hypothetical protein IQ247_27155 [Plectonema cf. radiosum LEGE 06105]|uniref:Uncharacterized protein n=1 Tax=Plectonema cf. radiosum LEGE 06105 TaxID=945769 RepID=A0A8J7K7S9_9CYAN|nr:hypothetical protein [Plectonema radiosum]MBE9216297.1 hypothetical protein [Plectonema cf. radiosum LEGE 06105]